MTDLDFAGRQAAGLLPDWVPAGALHYIAHTEGGQPIRALARQAGCHASTILRQIRKVEMRRDDPLVDAALRKLGTPPQIMRKGAKDRPPMTSHSALDMPDEETLAREAMRALRRLCETGAILAVAADLDKAVVVRDMPGGGTARTATVDAAVAQAMALKDWIAPANSGRIVRYHITGAGRSALGGLLDRFGVPQDIGAEETTAPVHGQGTNAGEDGDPARRSRYGMGESPLSALARRRDREGKPFLNEALVHAGERLREDFELAQMNGGPATDWERFVSAIPMPEPEPSATEDSRSAAARARVQGALVNLGPGLSEVALHCCCFLEGLETTEKRLGWSARSGKIVLRIALMRLRRYYDETVGAAGAMIG
ncbi:DUF6456 domain-containing protein [Marimonas sp. MJW-29]|uniref:DUF6456 domain-containing protein n=1 Tax=Sulfitobacter sediminis TaxID=3234186 RepID=A0ABV3RP77_9RHOB